MKQKSIVAACAAAALLAGCATTYSTTPVALGDQEVRYDRGVPTVTSAKQGSTVSVYPVGINERGRMVFQVAAFNSADQAFNFGVENVRFEAAGSPTRLFTYAELEREARNEATAALVLTALAAGASAYAAQQNAYNTTSGYVTTSSGTSTFYARTYNPTAAAVGVSAATASGAYTMHQIQRNLDGTLQELGAKLLQTTTVDPGQSIAGTIVSDRVRVPSDASLRTQLRVQIRDEVHAFEFDTTKQR